MDDPAAAAAAASRSGLERHLAATPDLAALLPKGYLAAVERYIALLLAGNRRVNLTRITEPSAVATDHLLDSVAALPLIDRISPERAVDLGSGGGVPAFPLALARPEVAWTLVESVGKKAALLRDFAEALGVRNVSVVARRAEEVGRDPAARGRNQLVTARACAALPVLVEYALPLLAEGGVLLAWKGAIGEGDAEVRAGAAAARLVGGTPPRVETTAIPALGGRRFVLVEKVGATPERFPRRPGEPARRPLG
jgi:16S rRNA (guanine527-N7)-methyltransferase